MTLILRRKKYVFSAGKHGCCIMISSLETEVLRRIAVIGEHDSHIALTGMEQWLSDYAISTSKIKDIYSEMARSWSMTATMREGCDQLMSLDTKASPLQKDLLGLTLLNLTWKHYLWWSEKNSLSYDNISYDHLDIKQSLEALMHKGIFDSQSFAGYLNISLRTLQRRAQEQLDCTLKDWVTHRRFIISRASDDRKRRVHFRGGLVGWLSS